MLELNITALFKTPDFRPSYYSASCAELGQDAGAITWQNAVDRGEEIDLLSTDDNREVFRDSLKEYGAWTVEEIAAWSDVELNALLLQFISGEIRESGLDVNNPDWQQYEKDCERGQIAGNLFTSDDSIYYYIGG